MLSRSIQGAPGGRISTAVVTEMDTQRLLTQPSLLEQRPIEFLTENDFSIIRLSDIDKSISAVGASHEFLVRDPHGYELHITVEISGDVIAEIAMRCRDRIT